MLFSISRYLVLRTSCQLFPRFFYLLYSMTKDQSLTLAILNWVKRCSSVFMQSKIEQFLILKKMECQQKRLVCQRQRKKWDSCCLQNYQEIRVASWFLKVQRDCYSQISWIVPSFQLPRMVRYSASWPQMYWNREMNVYMAEPSCITASWALYHTTNENLFSEFLRLLSSTLISLTSMTGVTLQFLQAQQKQASQMMSWMNAQVFSLHFLSCMQSSRVVRLTLAASVRVVRL